MVASIVVWYYQPAPTVAARTYLGDQGLAVDNLDLVSYEDTTVPMFPFPSNATVEFRVRGSDPPTKIEVNSFGSCTSFPGVEPPSGRRWRSRTSGLQSHGVGPVARASTKAKLLHVGAAGPAPTVGTGWNKPT
jgi:hypothetical protein